MWNALKLERTVGKHLRVRSWALLSKERLSGPEATHPAVELCWVEEGEVRYEVEGQQLLVRAGSAMVVPSRTEHLTHLLPGTQAVSIWLGEELIGELADALGPTVRDTRLQPGIPLSSERLIALGRLLRSEVAEQGAGHLLAADALAEALGVELLRGAPKKQGPRKTRHPQICAALQQIEAQYAEPLSVEELAKTAGMSRFHFSRLFHEQVGHSPYRFLLETRLARAAELLRRGRMSVTEAALTVGFADLGRFSRRFKERYQVSPRELIKAGGS